MKSRLEIIAATCLLVASSASGETPRRQLTQRVQIFYYGWYGTPEQNGKYFHWDQNERLPPQDIASSFYPSLGPYSSTDGDLIAQHMRWIQSMGVGVLIFAWQDDVLSREVTSLVMDTAWQYGIQVAFLIDQNPPKRPEEVIGAVETLTAQFGNHPAFYRIGRATRHGRSIDPRGVFYVFNPFLGGLVNPSEWVPWMDRLRDTYYDPVLLGQGFNLLANERAHFDGLFTFDVLKAEPGSFHSFKEQARQAGLIFVPTIGPGYDDQRAVDSPAGYRSREQGSLYDRFWEEVVRVQPEWVSLNSFNEWHEGTQIEPAVRMETPFARYRHYEGSYGRSGNDAESAYLLRTA
ncbi:MAG: hypothetical protein ACE5JI_06175, partial [Acidobacteriota bacterium]